MIEIHYLRNEFRVGENTIIALTGIKPYIVKQTSNSLIHSSKIEAPYSLNGDSFHTEAGFIELAKHLSISPEDYETVITSFHHAREASNKIIHII